MKKSFKKELIKYYLKSLGEGQKILDLNPGLDGIYNELKESKAEYLCLEQNPEVREFLEKNNISVTDWRIPEIPMENNSVDYVLSAPFIEHLPTYVDALNFLLEVKRILKPGGKILLIVPNYLSLKEIFYEDYKHEWVTTKKRIIDMLSDCQYEVLGFRYTIGWITMKMNPLTGILRLIIYIALSILRFNLVERLFETLKIHKFGYKVKKTLFELIVIEAQVRIDK
jgi:SAM-dependent methyltransferase